MLLESITNFIQLIPPQPVDLFSQTKLCYKASNEGYPHIWDVQKKQQITEISGYQ